MFRKMEIIRNKETVQPRLHHKKRKHWNNMNFLTTINKCQTVMK